MNTTKIDILADCVELTWATAIESNTWLTWNATYSTLKGVWLFAMYSGDKATEEYANMLMSISQIHRTAAPGRIAF